MMRKIAAILLFISLFIVGCGEYQKIKKSTNANVKMKKAIEYFNKQEYAKTLDLLDDIRPLYRGRTQAPTIEYYYAYALYEQKRYIEAGHYFNQLTRLYSKSPYMEECLYMKAFCYYKGTPVVLLDQTPTKEAIQAFETYAKRYPNSRRNQNANEYIKEMQNKLAEKSYLNARSYYERELYNAAIVALNNSLKKHPDSSFREDIMFMILASRYELATNSIPSKKHDRYNNAKEEFLSFIEEFPKSKYQGKVERMDKDINKYLGTE